MSSLDRIASLTNLNHQGSVLVDLNFHVLEGFLIEGAVLANVTGSYDNFSSNLVAESRHILGTTAQVLERDGFYTAEGNFGIAISGFITAWSVVLEEAEDDLAVGAVAVLCSAIPAFTVAGYLLVTLAGSIEIIVTLTLTLLAVYKWRAMSALAIEGISPVLLPLLTGIEIVSYWARAVSLGVRLFANTLAGHLLIKLISGAIAGLACSKLAYGSLVQIPLDGIYTGFGLLAATPLVILETVIGVLQGCIFALLGAFYETDVFALGH